MTVATHLRRTVASCLLAGLLGACLDLSLPSVPPDGGVGPELVIHTPREGDTIALNAPVTLEAASINGVSSVT